MWFEINKVIDSLHLANHSRRKCKELYDPEKAKKDFPEANFMSAGQTFAWQGQYKKNQFNDQNSLSLHDSRLIKGRNRYTSRCYKRNRKPLLQSAKVVKSKK